MPLPSITLAEFNKIASGQQNAGQVDFEKNSNGEFTGGLVRINNHVIRRSLNDVHLTGERVVAIIPSKDRSLWSVPGMPHKVDDRVYRELGAWLDAD